MHPVFSVDPDDVSRLTDEQARELIARLCRLELRNSGVSSSCVQWGGDQRAKDGGVDVFVDVDPPRGVAGYIKADMTAYQVKAEPFGPAKIPGEMAPKGFLRPAIRELAAAHGAYVICSTRSNTSKSALTERLSKMQAVLNDFAVEPGLKVDFYDARKIADWVETHPSAVVWVKHSLGTPIHGWRPYAAWAYREASTKSDYIVDEKTRVFTPDSDEGTGVVAAIRQIRDDVRAATPVRLVGLSGVGKTRLVQALFDDCVEAGSPALDPDKVIYTDTSLSPTPVPEAMVEALSHERDDVVLVVDNCGHELHARLVEAIRSKASPIRLITVEYDIRDDVADGSQCYRLEGASDEVIQKLLKDRFSFLSQSDIEVITRFSDGNFRVAFALASTTVTTGELARLRDEDLFQRLFVQKHESNEDLLVCAKAASLVYSFDFSDDGSSNEVGLLADIAGVKPQRFRSMVVELQRRGLVQARGKWRAVLPHAISNRLATQALEEFSRSSVVDPIAASGSERLLRSFSRRLGYLHESKQAQAITQTWLEPGGRFADFAALSEADLQIVSNIAPVNSEATLKAIESWICCASNLSAHPHVAPRLAALLRLLAYDPAHFERATTLLIELARSESGSGKSELSGYLKSLFFARLSGTEATPEQRLAIVERLLRSDQIVDEDIGAALLEAALESQHWSCAYGFEFGARKRSHGWWPRGNAGMRRWYDGFIFLTADIASHGSNRLAVRLRQLLGRALPSLWVFAGAEDAVSAATKALLMQGSWPEGWVGTRRALAWHRKELPLESLSKLSALELMLRPRKLEDEIRARVLTSGSFAEDFSDEEDPTNDVHRSLEAAHEKAVELGMQLAVDEELLRKLMPSLIGKTRGGGDIHGLGVGAGMGPDVPQTIKIAKEALTALDGNASLFFIRGVVGAWHRLDKDQAEAFLDEAVTDDVWRRWFPELQCQVPLDDAAFTRILRAINGDFAPAWQYVYLSLGGATATLSITQISTLIEELSNRSSAHLLAAIEILSMVAYAANERPEPERRELAKQCFRLVERFDWRVVRVAESDVKHELESIIKFAAKWTDDVDGVRKALSSMVAKSIPRDQYLHVGIGDYLEPLFERFPSEALQAVFIRDEEGSFDLATSLVSRSFSNSGTAVEAVTCKTLADWCEEDPAERCLFAARTCKIFANTNEQEGDSGVHFSDTVLAIFRHATDKPAVVEILADRCFAIRDLSLEATALDRGLGIFEALKVNDDPQLISALKSGADAVRDHIKWLSDFEDRHRRDRTESFE